MDQQTLIQMLPQLIADPKSAVIFVLLALGAAFKHICPWVPNKCIPAILIVIGVGSGIAFFLQEKGWAGSTAIGVVYGLLAVGAHSAIKNTLKSD